jgi:hypothetical protein
MSADTLDVRAITHQHCALEGAQKHHVSAGLVAHLKHYTKADIIQEIATALKATTRGVGVQAVATQ